MEFNQRVKREITLPSDRKGFSMAFKDLLNFCLIEGLLFF